LYLQQQLLDQHSSSAIGEPVFRRKNRESKQSWKPFSTHLCFYHFASKEALAI